jgi:ATP-binding protein involved in chromosome partitioning
MFERVNIPILGVIENMAYFLDSHGKKSFIFGKGGAKNYAAEIGVPFLGEVPIDQQIRENGDSGKAEASKLFGEIFSKLTS